MTIHKWWWLLLFCAVGLALDELCPVSMGPAHVLNNNYNYPLNIYNPRVQNEPNVSCIKDRHRRSVSCPIRPVGCPVIEDNIYDSVNYTKWPKISPICTLKKVLDNEKNISRLIVLGGSVTSGVDSFGCCNQSAECWYSICRRCSWTYHLGYWLRTIAKANVSLFDLAMPGTNSIFTSEVIQSIMMDNNLTSLNSGDVVILDFSFNDNVLSIPVEDTNIRKALEKLARYLIGMAIRPLDLPHIILLAIDTDDSYGPPENSYRHVYHEVARHYGLHLFSYVDAILSANSREKQAVFHDHLTTVARLGSQHPPWHGQLFYADFIAAILMNLMNKCTGATTTASNALISKPYQMPQPLTEVNDSALCNSNPPLLRMSYKNIMSNTSTGRFEVVRPYTWTVGLDRKQRGGIMMSLNTSQTLDEMHDAPIVFSLGITVGELKKHNLLINIQYMRSYENAGAVSVGVCDTFYWDLDALWKGHKTYRHTLQDVFSAAILHDACNPAEKVDSDEVTISIAYKVQSNPEELNISQLALKKPRESQLFKITSVMVCQMRD